MINPSALDLFIIATPSPLTLWCLEVEKTFHGASLMQINLVTIYSLPGPGPGNLQKSDGKLHAASDAKALHGA